MNNLKLFFVPLFVLILGFSFVSAQLNVPTDLPGNAIMSISNTQVSGSTIGFGTNTKSIGDVNSDGISEFVVSD